jgi:hypothetical protein
LNRQLSNWTASLPYRYPSETGERPIGFGAPLLVRYIRGVSMKTARFFLAAFLLSGTAGAALAQDTSADPNYGTISLEAGFPDDPRVVALRAGGDLPASNAGPNCSGFITDAPDVRLHYEAGSPTRVRAATKSGSAPIAPAPPSQPGCTFRRSAASNPPASRRARREAGPARFVLWTLRRHACYGCAGEGGHPNRASAADSPALERESP